MARVLQLVVGIIVFEIICCFCPLHVTGVRVSSCTATILPGLRNDGNLNTTRDILMEEPQEGLQDCARMIFKSTEAKSVQFCATPRMCTVFSTELTPAVIEHAMADSDCVLMKFACDDIKPKIDPIEVGTVNTANTATTLETISSTTLTPSTSLSTAATPPETHMSTGVTPSATSLTALTSQSPSTPLLSTIVTSAPLLSTTLASAPLLSTPVTSAPLLSTAVTSTPLLSTTVTSAPHTFTTVTSESSNPTSVSSTDLVTSDQPGDSELNPGDNCADILQAQPEAVSGVYWISTQNQTFKVFCDMDTDGGGWTLVWSYTFTNFSSNLTGALTPRPSWSASQGDVPISITPPLNETDFNAVDFSLWKFVGAQQFLVKSTINNWIVCNGSVLVEFKLGSIDCRVVKTISNSSCNDVVPIRFYTTNGFSSDYPLASRGPALAVTTSPYSIDTTAYYYFWASTSGSYCPVHDPCGLGRCYGHKPDPVMPYGNIYIR